MLAHKCLCLQSSSLREVMESLNESAISISVLTDSENKVTGVLSDGDIRRVLLIGASLDSPAEKYMNTNFIYTIKDRGKALSLLSPKVQQVIILNENNEFEDIVVFRHTAMIPISSPYLPGNELKYIIECIETNWISSQGAFVQKFEETFSKYHGGMKALTTSNGTTALHLALMGCGIGAGDEVIIPDSTFIATANAVIHSGATPVFVDVDPKSWCIDIEKFKAAITPKTKGVIPVHLYGHPAEMSEIKMICEEHNIFIIEDCAESLGSTHGGKYTGEFGDVSCFSFFSNKVITTGEGGMVLTHDENIYNKMKQLRDHGTSPTRRYWHDVVGYNYRLTNLQSAIGLAQMENVSTFLEHRLAIAKCYEKNLSKIKGFTLPQRPHNGQNIFWLYTIVIDENEAGFSRDTLMEYLRENDIDSRPFFPALHEQPALQHIASSQNDFPIATYLGKNGLSLPTSNEISLVDVQNICDVICNFYHK